jgi:putative peptidoglycan lipid II flippase
MAMFVIIGGAANGVVTLGAGMLAGLCLQVCAFFVRMRRAGVVYRPVLDLRNPALAAVRRAAWPVVLGSSLGAASPLVDQMFASALSAGNVSALNYALKVVSIPTGIIFSAVGRAVLPQLSRLAGAQDMRAFKATLHLHLWVVGGCTLLLIAPMTVLAHPLVRVLFERGAFSAEDTSRTAITLVGFAAGLLPMGLGFLLATTFAALGRTRVLLATDIFGLSANALLDGILSRLWQNLGIALATSIVYTCTFAILLFLMRRAIGSLGFLAPPPELLRLLRTVRLRRTIDPTRS